MKSFEDISHLFSEKNYSDAIQILGGDRIHSIVEKLREDLSYCGKKCDVYRHLIQFLTEHDVSSKSNEPLSDLERRWMELTRSHRGIYEQLGFALLLKMDAESMLIAMFSAESDTERHVISKHAYTIVAEARNIDLFTMLSGQMKLYPEKLLLKEEYDTLWKENKILVKSMTSGVMSNAIRNAIDAHKHSFVDQLNEYARVDWRQSIVDMITLVQVVDNIELCMNTIHGRLQSAFENICKETTEYVAKLNDLLKSLHTD